MNLDLLTLGLVLFFGVMGALTGGVFQLAHLAGVVVGGMACRAIGIRAGPLLAAKLGWTPLWGLLAATLIGFFAVYVAVHVIARLIISRVSRSPALTRLDRLIGFTLGGARAAFILYVLLSALIFFERPMAGVSSGLHFNTRGSHVADVVRAHNLFSTFTFPGLRGLAALSRAAGNPEEAAQIARSPEFQSLAQDPRVRGLLSDSSIQRSLQGGDYLSVLQNSRVITALSDSSLESKLQDVANLSEDAAPAAHSHKR